MEKERRITAPDGCEIEKVELVDGVAVVTFKPQERKLPKSWEEFCEMYPIKEGEACIDCYGTITEYCNDSIRDDEDILTFPDRATAEAVLALCQLIQLRNAYNGDWVPDLDSEEQEKYVITFVYSYNDAYSPLYFKNKEIADEFLRNFRPLIEKLKPLYGIKKGGKE